MRSASSAALIRACVKRFEVRVGHRLTRCRRDVSQGVAVGCAIGWLYVVVESTTAVHSNVAQPIEKMQQGAPWCGSSPFSYPTTQRMHHDAATRGGCNRGARRALGWGGIYKETFPKWWYAGGLLTVATWRWVRVQEIIRTPSWHGVCVSMTRATIVASSRKRRGGGTARRSAPPCHEDV